MKILFTAKGKDWNDKVDARFGRTEFFFIYDEEKEEIEIFDNREIVNQAHGAGPKTAQKAFEYNPDVLITGNGPGGNAETVLKKSDMKIFIGAGNLTIKEAYEKFKKGNLKEF